MKDESDYIRDIAEMRSMMERSSKFLSLSGLAGIMAGIYALTGAAIAYKLFDFSPDEIMPRTASGISSSNLNIIFLALTILILALGTGVLFSHKKAVKRG